MFIQCTQSPLFSLSIVSNDPPLVVTAGVSSVGLTAAYYSAGTQTELTFFFAAPSSAARCKLTPLSILSFFNLYSSVWRASHRQHPVEALLRGGLPVCGHAEHGGVGGGRVRQNQEPD